MSGNCIRFVSDMHLGHEHALALHADQFAFLLEGCSTLVVCGDLAETRDCAFKEEGLRQKHLFEDMCRKSGVRLISLSGNHDPEQEEDIYTCLDGRVAALHGHCLFKEVAPWGWEYIKNKKACRTLIATYRTVEHDLHGRLELARSMSRLIPPILRNSEAGKKTIISKIKRIFWPPSRPISILSAWMTMDCRMRKFAEEFLPHARLICYGHFHRRHISEKNGTCFVNLGAFFTHATSYVVDLKDGQATVRKASLAGFGKTVKIISLAPSP